MFYRLITGDRTLTAFIFFLFALGIWMSSFLSPGIIEGRIIEGKMPLYLLLSSVFSGKVLLSKFFAFLLLLIAAFLLVRINAKLVLVQERTFLPAFFFISISGYNPELFQWNPVLPAAIFAILILEMVLRSYNEEPNSFRFFDAGILLGTGSLFYAPLLYLLVFIWIANIVQRSFYWREYLFPLLGLTLPYIFVLVFYFFAGKSIPDFIRTIASEFTFSFGLPRFHWIYWGFILYAGFFIVISSVFLLKVFQFRKIYVRNYFTVLFWLFLVSLSVFLFFSGMNIGISYLIGIPVSYILTNYFINARKSRINQVLLYMLAVYVLFLSAENLFHIF